MWAELDLEAEPESSDGTEVILLIEMVENLHLANSQLSKSEVHPGDWSLVSSNGSELKCMFDQGLVEPVGKSRH